MSIIFTSREFNQDVGRAKRAALSGPVFITDRGRPSHVLLTADEYDRLAAMFEAARSSENAPTILDLLGNVPEVGDIDLDAVLPPRSVDTSRHDFPFE